MKNKSVTKKILSLLLTAVMVLSTANITVFAAVGDLSNVSTGLSGNIDVTDTVSFPIQILDYEADGMLFEYAESKEVKAPTDFGATAYASNFTSITALSNVTTTMYGDFWGYTSTALNTSNSNASYLRVSWAKASTQAPHDWTNQGNRAGVIMPNDISISMDNARYLVLVYRSNVTNGNIAFFVERANAGRTNTNNRTQEYTFTSEGTSNWTYAVYDLKQGNLANTWNSYGNATAVWTTLPIDASGEYMDIAYCCLFANKDQAEYFGEYALTEGSDRGDNRAFGLLRSSRKEDGTDNYAGIIDKTTTVEQLNTYGATTSIDYSTITSLGYDLLGIFGDNGIANVGLLESSLSEDGYPVYKQEAVEYLAGLLEHSLEIPERTSDGWKNYRYIKGTPSEIYGGTDLATALRTRINGNTGSYSEAASKDLIGTWTEVSGNISSYHDAAYFLLNNIFRPNSYNEPQNTYDHLILSAGTDNKTGEKAYIFDAGFTTSSTPSSAQMAIDYNTTDKTIKNTDATGKTHFVYEGTSTTTLNPFLPVTDKNNASDQTVSPYYQDDGVLSTNTTKDTYVNRNFNFALTSYGEFIYRADKELFFDFEGDDDVYLFINGELVMDIGSAHSIDTVHFEVNDYVNWAKENINNADPVIAARAQKLNLLEDHAYSFRFFYMERHGYGSNMRISNNFIISDPSMLTEKRGYQNDIQIDYGSIVNKDEVVEYGFALTNTGDEVLYNLTFKDADIGVELTYDAGLTVTGPRVYDKNGGALTASDITAVVSHPDYADIEVTFNNNDELKAFLTDFSSSAVISDGGGLWMKSTVLFRGIGYKLSAEQINTGVFDNTVSTSSTNKIKTKTLHGQAIMRVFVPSDPMYYQWAGHELEISKTKLITDILEASNQEDNLLNGKVPNLTTSNVDKIEFTTSKGNPITYENVTMDSSYNLTVNYPNAGSSVFYVTVTYNSSKNSVTAPVLINITDVEDKVYVLDYGLSVDLTENGELYKDDIVTVPGRNTITKHWGITTDTPSYSPNNISFNAVSGNTLDGKYGDFTFEGESIKYTPDKFMEGADSSYIAVGVYEDGYSNNTLGDVNINKEVQMYKSVTTIPANVVYYEDSFPAINYNTATENKFTSVVPETMPAQSADQNEHYGHDSAYANTTVDEFSAGSITTIELKDYGTVASFTFRGTGFELIGRTNAKDSATIVVQVKDENGNIIKTIPVITEYDNFDNEGDETIYQVPVIRVKDLSSVAETYTVSISGFPARDYDNPDANGIPPIIPTYLYIDGLRIYQPIEGVTENGEVLEDYYTDDEKDAVFTELRNEIVAGNIGTVKYNTTDGITVSTATSTWTEHLSESIYDYQLKFNAVSTIDDYLLKGPNNEIYQTGTYDNAALVFYVKETDAASHGLQIGIRGLDESLFFAGIESDAAADVNATVRVGVVEDNGYKWDEALASITSSTEQYYKIDYKKCYYDSEKAAYQIVIRVDEGLVSFTGLKLTGLELVSIKGENTDLYYENGILMQPSQSEEAAEPAEPALFANFYSLRNQMQSTDVIEEPEVLPAEPETEEETTAESSEDEETEAPGAFSALSKIIDNIFAVLNKIFNILKNLFVRQH